MSGNGTIFLIFQTFEFSNIFARKKKGFYVVLKWFSTTVNIFGLQKLCSFILLFYEWLEMHWDSRSNVAEEGLQRKRVACCYWCGYFFSPPCCWKKVTKNRSLGPATAAATHSKGRQWLGQHWNPAETTAGAARKVTPWTNTRHNFKVGKNQVSLLKWLLNWNSINSPKKYFGQRIQKV